jgi:hypothetical protein
MTAKLTIMANHPEPDTPDSAENGLVCPECGGGKVYRSRYRSWLERMRRRISARHPYRCWDCDWRGWQVPPPQDDQKPEFVWLGATVPPDLDAIDEAVSVPEPLPHSRGPDTDKST